LPTEATLNSERPSSTVRLLPDMIYKVQVSCGHGQGSGGSISDPTKWPSTLTQFRLDFFA
jgi:hypothetical protein